MKKYFLFLIITIALSACKTKKEKLLNTVWKSEFSIYNETGVINYWNSIFLFGKDGKFYYCEIKNGQLANFELDNGFHGDVDSGQRIWEFCGDTLKTPMSNYFVLKLNSDSLVLDDLKYKESIHFKRINLKVPENLK